MDKKLITIPTTFKNCYTDEDKRIVIDAINFLNSINKSIAYIHRLCNIPKGTLSRLLAGSYISPPNKHLIKIAQAIARAKDKNKNQDIAFVKTSVYQLTKSICDRSRKYANFGLLSGYVGIGKTFSLKQYKKENANTIIIEANPDMTPGALLNEMLVAANAVAERKNPNANEKITAVINQLKGSDTLLIIDEAETIQPRTLHYLRRIRDKAGIGIVLSGTEYLLGLIKPAHGQFDQIRSRTPFIPETVKAISIDDAKALIKSGLGSEDKKIINRLWRYSQGSARMLAEGLIPAIIDFGLNRGHKLTEQLIDSVAVKALGLKLVK